MSARSLQDLLIYFEPAPADARASNAMVFVGADEGLQSIPAGSA